MLIRSSFLCCLAILSACSFRNEADTSAANEQLKLELDASLPLKREDFKHEFILDEKTNEYVAKVSWPVGRPLQIKFFQSEKVLSTIDGRHASSYQIPCLDNQLSYSIQVVSARTGTLADLDITMECSTGKSQSGSVRRERMNCTHFETFLILTDEPPSEGGLESETNSTRKITTSRDGLHEKIESQSNSASMQYARENGIRTKVSHRSAVNTVVADFYTTNDANGLKRIRSTVSGTRTWKFRPPLRPHETRDEASTTFKSHGESLFQIVGNREIGISSTEDGRPVEIGRPVITTILVDGVKTVTITNDVPFITRDENGKPITNTLTAQSTCVSSQIK